MNMVRALGTALGLIGILSNVLKMPMFSGELTLLIGLGVGVGESGEVSTKGAGKR